MAGVVAEFSPCAGLVARLEINDHRVNSSHFHMYSDEHVGKLKLAHFAGRSSGSGQACCFDGSRDV
jgi:hypothetical protein